MAAVAALPPCLALPRRCQLPPMYPNHLPCYQEDVRAQRHPRYEVSDIMLLIASSIARFWSAEAQKSASISYPRNHIIRISILPYQQQQHNDYLTCRYILHAEPPIILRNSEKTNSKLSVVSSGQAIQQVSHSGNDCSHQQISQKAWHTNWSCM